VENSGRFGGTYAAPIVGLMIEKYLNDSICTASVAKKEKLSKLNLIPPRIHTEMRRQDSLRHSKDSAYLLAKGYIRLIRDTVGIDEDQVDKEELQRPKKDLPKPSKNTKDSIMASPAKLNEERKNNTENNQEQ